MTELNKNYNLEERTSLLGENVIKFCKTLERNAITMPLISQVVRSSTSVGANYMEANAASSRKDFKNKIYICKKEAQETRHWFRMIRSYDEKVNSQLAILDKETSELVLIFGKILSTLNKNKSLNN
ncbi:four helix bundle protein [Candidatus Jorgensenbacteria bacterium CG_4_10_14_0_8_um_filter_39_13]|uniref:Four helix bundle protein n=1 Tax=Candidatus Jorgensenbacteria bacterium CG_4_10_14_0_8_um_filter_39_13 TaxID=1974589 RepID=A0A2M7RHZ9_9BACT|nr:MAG: four helix bundle protein [Candidatus Jorgensenbacteria bacterium CG_4_8_14_3_um_filter_38_10]PIY96375.1 MAG: four helix bundle protein [Candidatus Jorgensenbacteria bacterium CG_4_10_14_0_8_um_filter_39_13]PJA94813.1 MAG: four helix bundle protein [Candidatus Jorgensenbacteria bacterium CG_4_9_14_3_um_filter_38_10]